MDLLTKKACKRDKEAWKSDKKIPLLRLLDKLRSETDYYLIFEFLNGGDLARLLRLSETSKSKGKLPEQLVRKLMIQVVKGIEFLHSWCKDVNESNILYKQKFIAHRDLKTDNIMLHFPSHTEPRTVSDEFIKNYLADVRNHISKGEDFYVPEVTIVDFGLSREYEDHQKGLCKTGCGTAYYVAPEIYEELNYDNRVDIWAIGTIIYKLLFGKYPFKGNELEIVKANTLKGDYSIRKNAEVSIEMLEIIHKCLKANPDERPMNIDLTIAFENFSLVKLLNE